MAIIFAKGPKTSKMSKAQAEAAIKKDPNFPKGAEATIDELEGHWVAAVHVADGNPFGQPADSSEEGPGPKSEGPDDTAPDDSSDDSSDGPPSDDGGDSDGPPKGDKDKGGEKHELTAIKDAIQKILVALGIPDETGEEGPVPGADGPPGPPGGPPPGPPGPGGPDEEIKHERAMKPGEAPPGTTPVGAPAFSHVNPLIANGTHPWLDKLGKEAQFEVAERIPEEHTAAGVDHELQQLCYGTGYKVKQIAEERNAQGHRIASAIISVH